jgi:hypothetical protein
MYVLITTEIKLARFDKAPMVLDKGFIAHATILCRTLFDMFFHVSPSQFLITIWTFNDGRRTNVLAAFFSQKHIATILTMLW